MSKVFLNHQQIKDLNLNIQLADENMQLVEKIKITKSANPEDWLGCLLLCSVSRKLYNTGLFEFRKQYFINQTFLNYETLVDKLKHNLHFKDLPAKVSQQTLKLLSQNISSFFALLKSKKLTKEQKSRLNLPQYYSKKGLAPIIFTSQALYKTSFKESFIHLSGTDLKFTSDLIKKIKFNQINQVRIIPSHKNPKGKELDTLDVFFTIEVVYTKINNFENKNNSINIHRQEIKKLGQVSKNKEQQVEVEFDLDNFHFASIDHNLNNLAVVLPSGKQFLYSLKPLKSTNHHWNKKIASIQCKIDNLKNENKHLRDITDTFSFFKSIFDNKHYRSFLTEETYQILVKQQYEETLERIRKNEIGIKKLINKKKRKTTKRNHYVENFAHQLSRQLINQLVELKVNNIIYGKNTNFKKEINLGSRLNQQFVQIPFNKIIDKLKYKAILANMKSFIL